MDPAHLERLCRDFHLGAVISIVESDEGVLNKNYILVTTVGKYFIKQIREKAIEKLNVTAVVERLMFERGIPAICMLETSAHEPFVIYDGKAYSVYAFIESDRSHQYSLEDYQRMGVLLGDIHRAGSQDIPDLLTQRQFKLTAKADIRQILEEKKKHILALSRRESIDDDFLIYINLKLELLPNVRLETALANDTLIHGDYHAGNLLINGRTREIIGVCDWEKAQIAPRAYELARALLYISFSSDYQESSGIASARAILAGYQSSYPIGKDELVEGLRTRLHHTVGSTWLEHYHYDLHNARPDHFVTHETRIIRDFVQGNLPSQLV